MTRLSRADWPLIGRTEELELLRELRSGSSRASAVIRGPAGVGKTRLARAALDDAAGEGWATLVIRGSVGLAGMPLGPFRTALRIPVPAGVTEVSELAESVADELTGMRSDVGLLVLADDAQDLDESSAGLLHQLVASGLVVAMDTIRSDAQPPAVLTDLWKDGFAERIELQNLSRNETLELLAAGIGGTVQDSSANRLWHVTEGNPLYLREVVLGSVETGALKQVDGEWRWRGEWATGARIQEIVTARLGRLDPDELTVMEMLALAGALPFALVTGLAPVRAVESLESRGLVTTERSGGRLEVAISHRLHAEVLHSGMPALRQRSCRRNLVDALAATGTRRVADRVRMGCWSLELGLEVDPVTLSLGTGASLFAIGQAISGRLQEILPEAAVNLPRGGPAVVQDLDLAVRLAQAAYDRTGRVVDGVTLASTLSWTGATGSAEAVLARLEEKAEVLDDRLRLALALGWVRFWGRYDVDEARRGLMEAVENAGEGADRRIVAEIYQELAGISLNTGRPAVALVYAERAAAAQGVPLSHSVAVAPAAASLAYLGRCREALALVDEALPVAHDVGHPLTVATLLFARAGALARIGDLEEARTLAEWLREVAMSGGLADATAAFGVLLGEILLRQGRPASAGRIFRDSCGLLAERDVFGYRPWALAGLARARAQAGDEDAAASALDEARRSQAIGRHFDMSRYLAEIELHELAGRLDAAVGAALAAVSWARSSGMVIEEAHALDLWMRLDPSSALADRLVELAATTDSELVGVLADHARALVTGDAESLLEVSDRLAAMTAWRMAADAASAAAVVLARRHQARASRGAARAAARYAARCEGAPSPALDGAGSLTPLTRREREVATLAAAGRTSKEIAERMYLSSRTVENHLYRAYAKLGVTDRATLAAALAPSGPAE